MHKIVNCIQNLSFQLYPSQDSDRFTLLVEDIQKYSVQSKSANANTRDSRVKKTSLSHTTIELHSLQLSMERFYHSLEAVDNSYDDLNLPLFQDSLNKNTKYSASSKMIENVFHAHVEIDKKYVRQVCSEEKGSMPYLSGFFTGIYYISLIFSRYVSRTERLI